MVAGPSEVMVIADKTARPEFIAADLLEAPVVESSVEFLRQSMRFLAGR